MILTLAEKIYRRTKLRSLRYALNLLWYESFYYGRFGVLAYRYFPFWFNKIKPRLFELELTTHCPLRCEMCEHTYWDESEKHISLEEFQHIAREFRGFIWCGLTGIGSSFMNKDFLPILRYVKEEISPDIFIELYDHFLHLNKERAREIIRLGIDFMMISLDGSNADIYEKIRAGSKFDRVMENIENMIALKKEANSFFPELAFHYIISRHNLNDIPDFVRFIHKKFGNQTYKYIYFTAILHPFEQIRDLAVPVPEELVRETQKIADLLGIKLIWNRNIQPEKPAMKDCRAWIEPFIFSDGTVIPCCAGNEKNNRQQQRQLALGNIFEQGLEDLWSGMNYREFRRKLLGGRTPQQCRECPVREIPARQVS